MKDKIIAVITHPSLYPGIITLFLVTNVITHRHDSVPSAVFTAAALVCMTIVLLTQDVYHLRKEVLRLQGSIDAQRVFDINFHNAIIKLLKETK